MSNAPGGVRKGAGRRATPIDLKELEILYALHSTDREIADRFGVSVRTIHNRSKEAEFGEVMRRGKARGLGNLRSAQMKLVNAGNAAMSIWLGKNLLGQTGSPSIRMAIPKIRAAADYGVAADKVMQAVTRGKITPAQGKEMMSILESHSTIVVNVEVMCRLEKLEQNAAATSVSGMTVVGPSVRGAA
jgi:DNA-binding Lrp family transcriptional regulator